MEELLRERSLGCREVALSAVLAGRETELEWRGLTGSTAHLLMSARWFPLRELAGSEQLPGSGVLSFTVLSVLSPAGIVPAISLTLSRPAPAETQYRQTWSSTSIKRAAKAREFHLGAGNLDFDMAIHGGGMLRFTAGQGQLEVCLQDKLTKKNWSRTVSMAEMRSPETISLLHHEDQSDVVQLCLKFKIFSQ